jgi:cytochrome c oxidase cbb3-type subunit 3
VKAPAALLLAGLALAACQREERAPRADPGMQEGELRVVLVPLSPGGTGPHVESSGKGQDYEGSAYHVAQGKTLYRWFNCNGCHFNGGGGSGPALMDDAWIYGGSFENIVQTIREGRPNGMPSFRGRIPDDQIYEIAAYVRSMSGNVASDVAPGRDDAMQAHAAENRAPAPPPPPPDAAPR